MSDHTTFFSDLNQQKKKKKFNSENLKYRRKFETVHKNPKTSNVLKRPPLWLFFPEF